ncbi:hypothetical protein PMI15_00659 [Polaromonas sp. CF318]|uniref:beta strand repeat-containing protein n=1 Tax=Polaromonas sp. CF318 TaxID=1144318 RepID=UPI000270E2AA|nr:hypothetical protein [Polaromonas sp. CF318]EJL89222.1 hypothetical protein PMI15_00659 [Polaromonas sp. CF318]
MNQPHQADKQTVATANPVHAENLPVTVAAAHTVPPQVFVQQATSAEKAVQSAKPATAGKAPAPNAAAAIQMEQEAAASQARQSADKLLRKKRLGESEGDQNAESSVDSSYDVVAANTTEAAAPAEEATAASASGAAGSGGAAWLPIAGGGLGLAAIAGGGGGTAAVTAAAATVSTFAVSISAFAGPVTAALNYRIYDAQGKVIASGVTDAIYGGSIATNTLLREVNNSDGGTNQQVVFSDIGTAHPTWTNVTSFSGGDNALEAASVITGTAEANASVALTLGAGNVHTVTANGSGVWSYSLVGADITAMGQGAETLSATQTDLAGNLSVAGTRAITVNASGATVAGVALSSAGVQNNTLNANDIVTATVTFSEAVTVTGTPQLALNISGSTVQANYVSGSGGTELTFTYTILAGQTDANGIAVAANSLALNSGTIKDSASNDAVLTHTALADSASFKVDTTAPAAPTMAVVATDDYVSGSGSTALTFTYTILAGETDGNGLGVVANGLTLNGGAIKDSASKDVVLTHAAIASDLNYIVDTTAPAAPVIDIVASNDVIDSTEVFSSITGTNETGATVTLSFGGAAHAATVTGTTWSYSPTIADIAAMHQGAETLSATQTDLAGNTSVAGTRNITVSTGGIISMTAAGNQTLNLSLQDVLDFTSVTSGNTVADTIRITGNAGDIMNLNAMTEALTTPANGSSLTDVDGTTLNVVTSSAGNASTNDVVISGTTYDVYQYMHSGHTVTLLVNTAVTANVI